MKAYTINTEFDASDKYIVDNIIARKSITLIVASHKKGKTALGLNLGICINEGIDFLENKVNKTKGVYYCNELSGKLIQERIKRLDIPCSGSMKFYEGTSYVDFDDFERIVKADTDLGYEVFIIVSNTSIQILTTYKSNVKLLGILSLPCLSVLYLKSIDVLFWGNIDLIIESIIDISISSFPNIFLIIGFVVSGKLLNQCILTIYPILKYKEEYMFS